MRRRTTPAGALRPRTPRRRDRCRRCSSRRNQVDLAGCAAVVAAMHFSAEHQTPPASPRGQEDEVLEYVRRPATAPRRRPDWCRCRRSCGTPAAPRRRRRSAFRRALRRWSIRPRRSPSTTAGTPTTAVSISDPDSAVASTSELRSELKASNTAAASAPTSSTSWRARNLTAEVADRSAQKTGAEVDPMTSAASGTGSKNSAPYRGPPGSSTASRTRPASRSDCRACETVGFEIRHGARSRRGRWARRRGSPPRTVRFVEVLQQRRHGARDAHLVNNSNSKEPMTRKLDFGNHRFECPRSES